MTLNHEIEIDKKEYSSKPEAKKAAEQALAKHYYENGLEEYKKPQVENAKEETQTEIPDKETMGRSVTDNEREQTDESSQTEKSDAENLQPQQDKLTPLSKPIGEGGEQLKPKEGHIYRAVDNAADATGNDKSFSNKTNWYEGEGFLIEAKKAEGKNIEHHEGAKGVV